MTAASYRQMVTDINQTLAPLRKTQAEALDGFGQLARAAMTEGALSAKHKELIALAVGMARHCDGCLAFHVKALVRLGCSRAEFDEALSVAVYMGGGPALMVAADALAAWKEFGGAEV